MSERNFLLCGALLLALTFGVYSNHFQNGFHFDDWHTVTENPAIRSLGNIPGFFEGAQGMSVLPSHRDYRPLLMSSLALDYWLAGGLKPAWFQASTFVCFLALVACTLFLFRRILGNSANIAALFGAACFALHPVCAETVNYVVQRADAYVALSVVAGLLLWAQPRARKWGLYLIPMVLGCLFKATAGMFAPILAAYIALVENERPALALRRALPAAGAALGMMALTRLQTPPVFTTGGVAAWRYLITQPWVTLHYFGAFFLPVSLTADSDMKAFETPWNDACLTGFVFLAALVWAAWRCGKRAETRPIAFGLCWFLAALLPAALLPLAEVENDHRMFAPLAGLALAAACGARLLWQRHGARIGRWLPAAAALLILSALGAGAWQRNQVWRTDETLWRDVVEKSPANGRGLMNYGLTLMERGDYAGALDYYRRAQAFTPDYSYLEVNLGLAYAGLGRLGEAEPHFQRAVTLTPADPVPYFYYGQWLRDRGRDAEAKRYFQLALERNPAYEGARKQLAALEARPAGSEVVAAEAAARTSPTPENFVDLSLRYYQAKRFEDCIAAARRALMLRPAYAEAYNNIAAANGDLGRWDEAVEAATAALRIAPNFQLARNNLAYFQRMKAEKGKTPAK